MYTPKQVRLKKANRLIKTISEHGRKFFKDKKSGRLSHFEIANNGRLYYVDDYTGVHLPMSHTRSKRWGRYFSHGGTLKDVIERLGKYIRLGEHVNKVFGTWPEWYSKGDPWGYGEDMKKVRERSVELGISKVNKEKENE